ncbi:ester cyclase [Alteromonas sediminis]|uniref:ester cyclase n=1 Tax=Alteromonas sediminis TaxID=2259342 RepID=UPI0014049088|nr:ester cyclase [Alteromonas sediminis]
MKSLNVDIVNRLINDVINQGNYHIIKDIVDNDYVYQAGEISFVGRDALEDLLRTYKATFPDLHISVIEQISTEDRVVTRGRLTGTQMGSYLDIPASGKQVNVDVAIFSSIRNGKIAKEFEIIDELTMCRQLGVNV